MKGSRLKSRDLWIDVVVLFVVILVLFPIVWTFLTSIKGRFDVSAMPPKLLFTPTTENYRKVFIEDGFYRYFKDSIIIALISTVIAVFLGTMAAYGLVRYRVGGKFLPFWILSTRMLPPIAIILPIYILMQRVRLIDTYASIIIMHVLLNLPFAVWLMSGFFREVPSEIDEAALLDGCSVFGAFIRILFPVVIPGVLATTVFCLITSWNEYLFALILSGRNVKTLPVAAAFYVTDRDILWGPMAAVAVVASIPIIIFTLLIQKHLVRGLSYGAIK